MINLLLKISKTRTKEKKLIIIWWSEWTKIDVFLIFFSFLITFLDTGFAFSQEENLEMTDVKRMRF